MGKWTDVDMTDVDAAQEQSARLDKELIDRQNMRIARLAGLVSYLEIEKNKSKAELERVKKLNARNLGDLNDLRTAVLDAVPLIEDAINALDRHDIEVAGLNSALADLQALTR